MVKIETGKKKVFVSGCFDMLHSGHFAFLQEASQYGNVYIGLGSDKTIKELGIGYKILRRIPHSNLLARSTTSLYSVKSMPYRIDLAGTWIDQLYVSEYYPG
jgi:bifunctional ADP-heptose synthase (sugar kinase/adenylyltransferase)